MNKHIGNCGLMALPPGLKGYLQGQKQQEQIFPLAQLTSLPSSSRRAPILELGCGTELWPPSILPNRDLLWGIDLSETAIRWAEERFQRVGLSAHFLVGHVGDIHQCQDATFELIIDGSCLHCLIDDARTRCFAEVRRLLKPGGRFVVGSMCGTPRYPEDRATYHAAKHHLLKNGQPWRTLRPLPALINELREAQLMYCDPREQQPMVGSCHPGMFSESVCVIDHSNHTSHPPQ